MSSYYYKQLKWDRERELRDYKKRKKQVEDIRNKISRDFENNASDINRQYRNAANAIRRGIVIRGGHSSAASQGLFYEHGASDWNMSSAGGYVNLEIQRVMNIISDLEREIRRLETAIWQEQENERKERQEVLNRLLGVD